MNTPATEQVMRLIDRLSEPKAMSKQVALDFLEQIETDLQGRMESLRDELAEGGEE